MEKTNKDAASSLRERLRASSVTGTADPAATPVTENVATVPFKVEGETENGQIGEQHCGVGVLMRKRPLECETGDQQGPSKMSCSVDTDDAVEKSGDPSTRANDSAMKMWDDLGVGADAKISGPAVGENPAMDTKVLLCPNSYPCHKASQIMSHSDMSKHAEPPDQAG